MIKIKDKKECSGCAACSQACPSGCIKMMKDPEGFTYPVVIREKCSDCGVCERVCPIQNRGLETEFCKIPETYAAVNKKKSEGSSSGGIFPLLSSYVLDKGGIVFGAAMSKSCEKVVHMGVEETESLRFLQGSKYVQSDIENTFILARKELEKGRFILFSGTPCQIAGLKSYLKRDYDTLLTVEVICHGVPSPLLWRKYIHYVKSKLKASIENVDFRHKNIRDVKELMMYIKATNGRIYKDYEDNDPFYCFFLNNYCLRPSCYSCHFKSCNHLADITIGDFWGIEHVAPEFPKGEKVSLVLLHSEKGKNVFELLKKDMRIQQTEYKESISNNNAYLKSVPYPKERDSFFCDLRKLPFRKVIRKYRKRSIKMRIRLVLEKMHLLYIAKKVMHSIKPQMN